MSVNTPITSASEPPPPLVPREIRLRLDPLLLLAALGLVVCSIVALKGATADDVPGSPHYYVYRQLGFAGAGIVIMYLCSRLDYSRLRELRYPLYGFMIAAILIVYALGTATKGSKRWIHTPLVNLQPSELGKVLLVVAISGFLVDRMRRLGGGGRETTARVMLLGLFPAMLVMAQPDLGSALVYVAGTLGLLFVAGVPWRHFAALGALGAVAIALTLVALPAVGVNVLETYQKDRLTSFLHPSDVAGKEGYQQKQSIIAIGAGEKTGRGVQHATQTGLDFLPEHHTDFIFAVVGETYGFAGAALVLSLYALLLWRGLHILTQAKNLFGALIAGGITMMLLFQIFVNVGMTVGIMPITGIPAPLLSYGGSSMLVTFLALGLLQSIAAQAKEAGALKTRMTA
ncbi:MAG: rod shape determining protein RodA [Solirubrobacteraceae bacterium]|jgi:rod shape determining protein RodA|nr:rod shape determining protein RodA [Solirubrobacteraceae bacterium]